MTRRQFIWSASLVVTGGLLAIVLGNRRIQAIFDRRTSAHGVADRSSNGTIGRDASGVANRDSARPSRVDIAVAQLGSDATAAENSDLLMVADVGNLQTVLLPQPSLSKPGGDQSDGECIYAALEPPHAVAPVPMHEEALAAISVQLASFSLSSHSRVTQKALVPAIVDQCRPAIARTAAVESIKQVIYPDDRGTASVLTATLIGAPAQVTKDRMCDWSLTDESPLMDPASLLRDMQLDDPLRGVIEQWMPGSKSDVAKTPSATSEEGVHLTARTSFSWRNLYEMGRLSALLDSQSRQRVFWQATVQKASEPPDLVSPGESDLRSMEILAGTFICQWKDDASAAKALEILLRWEPPRSRRLFQITVLYTSALDSMGDERESEMVEPLTQLVLHSPSVSIADQFEARFVLSRVLFRQRRYLKGFAVLGAPLIPGRWEE